MIEEAHVPQCISLLARMTRRRLRLASHAGYPTGRPFPSWRNRIAEFLPATAAEAAVVDVSTAVAAETDLAPADAVEEHDPLAVPAMWAERALVELEATRGVEADDPSDPSEVEAPSLIAAEVMVTAHSSVESLAVADAESTRDFASSSIPPDAARTDELARSADPAGTLTSATIRELLPPPVLRERAGEGAGTDNAAPESPLPNPPPEYRGREHAPQFSVSSPPGEAK